MGDLRDAIYSEIGTRFGHGFRSRPKTDEQIEEELRLRAEVLLRFFEDLSDDLTVRELREEAENLKNGG